MTILLFRFRTTWRLLAIFAMLLSVVSRAEIATDPLTGEATRKTVAEHVARWMNAGYFHREKALSDLFDALAKLGVYPKGASFGRLGGMGLFSLSGLKSGGTPVQAAMGFGSAVGSAGLDSSFRMSPVVTVQADGHFVTYVLARDGAKVKVDKILEHGTQYSAQGEHLAPKLKVFDEANPRVADSARPYRVRRKLALCEAESDEIRKVVVSFLEKAVVKANDPTLTLGEEDFEPLFRTLQAKGLFAGVKFDRHFFVSSTLADARKAGEATLTLVMPQIFRSAGIPSGVALGDDALTFRYPLNGEVRKRSEKPLNCTDDEVRRLTQVSREIDRVDRNTLPHAAAELRTGAH